MAEKKTLEELEKENKSLKLKFKKESKLKYKPSYYAKKTLKEYEKGLAKKSGEKLAKQQIFQQKIQKAPISISTQQLALQQQIAAKRERQFSIAGSRAEQLECQFCAFDETPLLKNMELQRTRGTTPPDASMTRIIKEVSDSFPD